MEEICNYKYCTGCKACSNVCPKNAIQFEVDELGRELPHIDEDKCVNCNLCKITCPAINQSEIKVSNRCYAGWALSRSERTESTSGGVAFALAREIVTAGGVVFGAVFQNDTDLSLKFVAAKNMTDIEQFRGSKYVFSDIEYSYREVRDYLDKGMEVLFIGLPCQIAGIKAYLKRKYDNLYLVDMVCHGAPPITYLREYVYANAVNITNVTFRGKNDYYLCMYNNNRKLVFKKNSLTDGYFSAFSSGLISKENCYSCRYARRERCGDITIGDYWGLNRRTLKKKHYGRVSLVLENTNQGKKLLDRCYKSLYLEERKLEEAWEGNAQLNKPSEIHKCRGTFEAIYPKEGFVSAINKSGILNFSLKDRVYVWIKIWYRKLKTLMVKAFEKE